MQHRYSKVELSVFVLACSLKPLDLQEHVMTAPADGRIREIDCWEIARVAKRAGAPANPVAGVKLLCTVGNVVAKGEPLFEIHA